jgi:hypothetical protein
MVNLNNLMANLNNLMANLNNLTAKLKNLTAKLKNLTAKLNNLVLSTSQQQLKEWDLKRKQAILSGERLILKELVSSHLVLSQVVDAIVHVNGTLFSTWCQQ